MKAYRGCDGGVLPSEINSYGTYKELLVGEDDMHRITVYVLITICYINSSIRK